MKTWIILLLTSLLTACASTNASKIASMQFNDTGFAPPGTIIDADQVMAVSKEMHAYLKNEVVPQFLNKGPHRALFDAISSKSQIRLEYDAELTRNAAQAFQARSGNCLSLVLMTAALAKQLGLEVQYQNIILNESWSRADDIYFSTGHVNIVLGRRQGLTHSTVDYAQTMVIDFLPPAELRGQRSVPLKEITVIAMYFNNRAAESLAKHQVDDAYWYARAALHSDPTFLAAYNTLGVVYRQHGDLALAESVFKQILDTDANNTMALSNLIEVLHKAERPTEALVYLGRLEQLQPYPPFYFLNRGIAAMERGEFREASTLFKREIRRDPNYDQSHFWLAQAYLKLGEIADAREELVLAQANSTTRKSHDIYAGKLEKIKAAYNHQ